MKINWKLRLQNKATVIALISIAFLLAQQVLAIFGVTWDYSTLLTQITGVVGTVFSLLAALGIWVDPTTHSVNDSAEALNRTEPKKEETK